MKKRTKKEERPLTMEEKLENAWKEAQTSEKFHSFGSPTYTFHVGDKVLLGGLENIVVVDVKQKENGELFYGIEYDNFDNRTKEFVGRLVRYVPWYDARPVSCLEGDTNFATEDEIRINFYNQSIESLLNRFYLAGVEMDPPYQRDYVWDEKDKEALLDSIFNHIEIGKFAFIARDWTHEKHFEILDGKQRLSTLLDFYENRLPYKGKYFNELSKKDRWAFMNANVFAGETSELTPEQICKYFYTLNKAGKVMDEEHLKKVAEMAGMVQWEDFEANKSEEEESRDIDR